MAEKTETPGATPSYPTGMLPEAYQVPTGYVNRLHILNSATITKIIFGEETIQGETFWRVSIATPPQTAREFVIVMANVLGITQAEMDAVKNSAPETT